MREKHRLTDQDVESFFAAANSKPKEIRPVTIGSLRKEIRTVNPVRWVRLQRDLRWLKKQMRKRGYREEDARWLL